MTGNFTAAADRFAAAGDPAGAAEPVPRISGQPGTVSAAPTWTAPQPGGGGRITVARDVLRGVAGRMRSELATLDSAVSRVRAAGAGVGSLAGWPTGNAFSGNAINAHNGCLSASEQVGDGHQAVAGNLSDSAATYDAAESDSTQAVHGVAAVLDGSPAASSAAAGNAFGGGTAATPSGRAGGAALAAGPYPVKSNDVQPFDAAGMTTAQIMSILHRLDCGAVAEAGTAHTALGRELDTMAGHLTGYAQTLAQSWAGTAAQAAMARLQQLYDQTSVLAAQAAQTGSALTWLGTDVLPAFQRLQTPGTGSALATGATAGGVIGGAVAGAGGAMAGTAGGAAAAGLDALLTGASAAAQAQAQKYLSALSGYLVTANSALPGQIGGLALASATRGGPGTNGTDEAAAGGAAAGAASAGGPASGAATGPGTGRSGPAGQVTSRTAAGSGGLVLGGAGGAGAALSTGRTGSAAAAGGAGSAPGTGSGGSAADAVAGSPSDAGGGGSALPAAATGSAPGAGGSALPGAATGSAPGAGGSALSGAATGSAPGAGGSALSGAGAGAPVSGASRIASPAPAASSLQSAAPVPGSTPGVAPVPPPAAAAAPGTSGAPAAAGMLPGVQGATGAAGVPQVPGLDGGLTGGATPVPEGPGRVAPSAVPGAVPRAVPGAGPVAGATGSFVVTTDGTAVPGSGDSSGRGMLGGMPMAGGTGQPEKERMRRAWGSEDENVWGLPSGCVPPVIEGD